MELRYEVNAIGMNLGRNLQKIFLNLEKKHALQNQV